MGFCNRSWLTGLKQRRNLYISPTQKMCKYKNFILHALVEVYVGFVLSDVLNYLSVPPPTNLLLSDTDRFVEIPCFPLSSLRALGSRGDINENRKASLHSTTNLAYRRL